MAKKPQAKLEDIVENSNLSAQSKRKFIASIDKFQSLSEKYGVDSTQFSKNTAYQEEIATLEHTKDTMNSSAYQNKLLEIRYKHFPQLREFDREVLNAEKYLETLD